MVTMEYEGRTYRRYNGNWIDSSCMIAPLVVQEALDKRYAQSLSSEKKSVKELVDLANEFRRNQSYRLAEKHYREALSHPNLELSDRKYIIPRLTSCLRCLEKPREAIDLYLETKRKYGNQMITDGLLTSAAAAYCDINQFDEAKKLANQALAMLNGKASSELIAVFKRIKRATDK